MRRVHKPRRVRKPRSIFDGDGDLEGTAKDPRLKTQQQQVYELMRGGDGWTVEELRRAGVRGSEAAIGARIRDLRKAKWGAFTVEKRHEGNGVYVFTLIPGSGDEKRFKRLSSSKN